MTPNDLAALGETLNSLLERVDSLSESLDLLDQKIQQLGVTDHDGQPVADLDVVAEYREVASGEVSRRPSDEVGSALEVLPECGPQLLVGHVANGRSAGENSSAVSGKRMTPRGSALIALAVVCLIFGAIVATCLYFASQADTRPLIERVGQSISGVVGGVL